MREKLIQQFEHLVNEASESELTILKTYLDSIERKRTHPVGSYIGALLQMDGKMMGEDSFKITIPNSELIHNNLNMMHGGITATVLDSAMGTLAIKVLPPDKAAVTSELKINYLAPGVGSSFKAVATIINKGKNIIVIEGRATRDDGKLIAHATGSFFIIPRP